MKRPPSSRSIFRPSLLNVSLSVVYLSLVFLFFSPALGHVRIVPCLVGDDWSLCTINPITMEEDTLYFGILFMDYAYQFVYLLAMFALSYVLGAISIHLYERHTVQT